MLSGFEARVKRERSKMAQVEIDINKLDKAQKMFKSGIIFARALGKSHNYFYNVKQRGTCSDDVVEAIKSLTGIDVTKGSSNKPVKVIKETGTDYTEYLDMIFDKLEIQCILLQKLIKIWEGQG